MKWKITDPMQVLQIALLVCTVMNDLTSVDMTVSNRVDLVLRVSVSFFEESGGNLVSTGTKNRTKGHT